MQDSKRDTDIKNRLLDSVREGEGGMIWENNVETCILSYRQSRFDAWGRVLRAGAWDDPEGWDEEASRRKGLDKEHMYTRGWFMWMYGEKHHNIVK